MKKKKNGSYDDEVISIDDYVRIDTFVSGFYYLKKDY